MSWRIAVLILFVLAVPFFVAAQFASSTTYQIERGVVDDGGGRSTSTTFDERGSIGQPGTGVSSSTTYQIRGGFLHFAVPTVATTSVVTPSPTVILTGGGSGPRPPVSPEIIQSCDFNDDGKCNLVDLSIMLFFFERSGPSIARYDLNVNNRVDFPDVSVLMFYWTG